MVVVDVVESVRLMQEDEAGFIDRWRTFVQAVRSDIVHAHGARLVKSLGDGLLLVAPGARAAVAMALELQRLAAVIDKDGSTSAAFGIRAACHSADVASDDLDIYGSGVNLCARLASLAEPGGVVVSAEIRDEITDGIDGVLEDLGDCFLKHVAEPVRAYRIAASAAPEPLRPASGLAIDWPILAVVPFECSDGSDQTHIHGEACTDEVVARLAKTPHLRVTSTMSTRSLRARNLRATIAAAHVGADFVLTGRYRIDSDGLALFAEFADGRTGTILWADRIQVRTQSAGPTWGQAGAVIAEAVVKALMRRECERSEGRPLASLQAYTLFFAAVNLMHRASANDFARARAMLEELAWRHARHSAAHAWLAKWHVLRVVQGWAGDVQQDGAQAMDHSRRALEIDSRDALALSIGGLVHGYLHKDLAAAGRLYEAARESNPNEPLAWLFTATWHSYRDEGAQAAAAAHMALDLSPLDPMRYFFDSLAATALLAGGDHRRAIELCRSSLRANRSHASTWRTLALAQSLSGDMDAARSTVAKLLEVEPTITAARFLERYPGRESGHAQRYADALKEAGVPAG